MALPAYDQFPVPGIGHNSGSLAEELVEETVDLKKRAEDLAASAGRCVVTDADTAGKATLLAKMIRTHVQDIDARREERKRPFLEAGRTVDQHFANIASVIVQFDAKKRPIGGPLFDVLQKIDGYQREQERKAAEERRRLEEEARKQREAAEAAERARREAEERERRAAEEAARKVREAEEAARRAGDKAAAAEAARKRAEQEKAEAEARQRRMQQELEAERAREQAAALERQAAAVQAGPVDTGYGVKATRRTVRVGTIVDLKKALAHALKVDEAAIRTAVQGVVDRQIKAKVAAFPGVEITEQSSTVIR